MPEHQHITRHSSALRRALLTFGGTVVGMVFGTAIAQASDAPEAPVPTAQLSVRVSDEMHADLPEPVAEAAPVADEWADEPSVEDDGWVHDEERADEDQVDEELSRATEPEVDIAGREVDTHTDSGADTEIDLGIAVDAADTETDTEQQPAEGTPGPQVQRPVGDPGPTVETELDDSDRDDSTDASGDLLGGLLGSVVTTLDPLVTGLTEGVGDLVGGVVEPVLDPVLDPLGDTDDDTGDGSDDGLVDDVVEDLDPDLPDVVSDSDDTTADDTAAPSEPLTPTGNGVGAGQTEDSSGAADGWVDASDALPVPMGQRAPVTNSAASASRHDAGDPAAPGDDAVDAADKANAASNGSAPAGPADHDTTRDLSSAPSTTSHSGTDRTPTGGVLASALAPLGATALLVRRRRHGPSALRDRPHRTDVRPG